MQHLKDPLFRAIFDQLPEPRLILHPSGPNFMIIAANAAYLLATGYRQEQLSGHSIWDFFKPDAAGSSTSTVFKQGLEDTLRYLKPMKLPIFRFDTLAAGKMAQRWWQVEILPVLDEAGELSYLTCTTYNVTIHVQDQVAILDGKRTEAAMLIRQLQVDRELADSEQALHRAKELSESEYRFNRIVAVTPSGLCILKGKELVIDTINAPLLSLWGRTAKQILHQPLLTAFPELQDQPFLQMAQQVLANGQTLTMTEQPVIVVEPDGHQKTVFADFSCNALLNTDGRPEAVLITFNDVTDMVNANHLLQERKEELEAINEELEAMNEELEAMNEELQAMNEELNTVNDELTAAREAQG